MALTKNPKLALIPSGYKASKVYSVLPSDGVGDFDFSRSGNATRVNKEGLIETVDSNVPRLNYPLIDGVVSGCPSLLLEPLRRNLLRYSEDFSQSIWNKLTNTQVNSNEVISPNGTLNADELKAIATSTSLLAIEDGYSVTASKNYVVSFFAKMGSVRYIQLFNGSNQVLNNPRTNFDLQEGTITVSDANHEASIESYGNGWYRCIVKLNTALTSLQLYFSGILNGNAARSAVSNFTIGDNFYLWGAQLEDSGLGNNADYVSSYIPTSGSITTRSAETCNNAGDVNTFNDSEGVLFGEISALNNTVDGYTTINVGSNSIDNRLGFGFDDQSRIYGFKRTTTSWNIPIEANINEFNKVAISYDTNNNHFWLNGFKVGSNTTIGDIAQPIEIDFRASYGGEQFNGSTKQLQYFDKALNNTDLEELTSWRSFNEMARDLLYTIL